MDTVPRDVIECAILDGQIPQCGEGAEWCEQHGNCYRCAKDIHDMLVEEVRRLKAERDRALAELDKALGEREERGCIHYDPKRHYCDVHDCETEDYKRGFDEGFASADDWLAQHEDAMAEHGWVKLPVDADGVTWNIGDRTESGQVVYKLYLDKHGWSFYGLVNDIDPAIHRHYHEPTVEDVLSEMLDAVDDDRYEKDRIIAEYATKLRLADE